MKSLKWIASLCAVIVIIVYALNNQLKATQDVNIAQSDNYRDNRFHNIKAIEAPNIEKLVRIGVRVLTDQSIDNEPTQSLPIEKITRSQLDALNDQQIHLVKLGHSSILIKIYGNYWLFDPVFSERASPYKFIGPKRFHPTPINIAELPPIDKVIISHNHYDHLDKLAIQQLISKTKQFLVPLGVDGDLKKWGVSHKNIIALDWWQEIEIENALIAFTPSQHFSGRALSDRDNTLWGSWVIKTKDQSLYFSGDSGYFEGFRIIGEKYGPFDFTMIENGAYDDEWPDHHMTPEQSVQAHIDLRGRIMMPIHNGTFDLAFHAWNEPLDRITAAAVQQQIQITTPIVGQIFTIQDKPLIERWWRNL